jgi:hypothetical protein
MNPLRPCFKPEQFDAVVWNVARYSGDDSYATMRRLLPLIKPGGHLVVVSYNKYGRLAAATSRLSGSDHTRVAKHTVGEVLDWFDKAHLSFVRGVPALTFGRDDRGTLFAPSERGSRADHFWVQARQFIAPENNGSFLMVGRTPASSATAPEYVPAEEERLALSWR